ncbi:hypothetical protein ABEG18_23820 [Alsobacter sp. KACC 23698]|uniref:Uncharacterized protein n=1 Tax=Alsobacter sp. KACC 23698 TaxID=3149229 RepID=A0AAU7JEE8_9HYPH
MRTCLSIVLSCALATAAAGAALAQDRPAGLAPTPAQQGAQADTAPIRKDPADATGAITPRRIGQESERIVEGRRCSDVLQAPDQHPHAIWVRCRAN